MKSLIITDKHEQLGDGAMGTVFRWSKTRAIKVFTGWDEVKDHPLYEVDFNECVDWYPMNEFDNMSELHKINPDIAPKPYYKCYAKVGGVWYLGFVMEYINGYTVDNIKSWSERKTAMDLVQDELEKAGFFHDDLHDQNVMYDQVKKRLVVVDFGECESMINAAMEC